MNQACTEMKRRVVVTASVSSISVMMLMSSSSCRSQSRSRPCTRSRCHTCAGGCFRLGSSAGKRPCPRGQAADRAGPSTGPQADSCSRLQTCSQQGPCTGSGADLRACRGCVHNRLLLRGRVPGTVSGTYLFLFFSFSFASSCLRPLSTLHSFVPWT